MNKPDVDLLSHAVVPRDEFVEADLLVMVTVCVRALVNSEGLGTIYI